MKPFVFILISTFILSCTHSPRLDFKYGDKEQSISCENQNNALLNEALHSFEEDIINHNLSDNKTLVAAYGQYIYKGMLGSAPYQDIANSHSLAIRDALLEEGILSTKGAKNNLNYKHPAVECIVNNIKDADLKRTLNALIQTNSMDPSLFNSRLRNFGQLAEKNRHQAAFIALVSYYQNLVGLTLEPAKANE